MMSAMRRLSACRPTERRDGHGRSDPGDSLQLDSPDKSGWDDVEIRAAWLFVLAMISPAAVVIRNA
jgi:hypothetical protein